MKKKLILILTIAIFIAVSGVSAQSQRKTSPSKKLRIVKIFLVNPNLAENAKNPGYLFAVTRRVNARAPLAAALKALTEGATKAEEKRGLHDSTFGIQFVSVEIKADGAALARFTMPDTATFAGTNSPFVFIEAVEKTALQFETVKKVTVCLDGAIDFWREDESEPKKC